MDRDRATACRVLQDAEQLMTGLMAGDAGVEETVRELLHSLIDVSSGPQLGLFLMVVDLAAAKSAKDADDGR